MNFNLETTDIDLGDTPIENIFINDFMPMANGTYVKVYLLGYKYAHDKDSNIEVDNETIAKHLNIPLADVLGAWDFWEEKGIIQKISKDVDNKYDYKVKFLNLKQLYIKNNYKPVTASIEEIKPNQFTCDPSQLIEANQSPVIQKMFTDIEYVFRRQLYPNEKHKVLDWMVNFNLNPDIIVKAFSYSVEIKGSRNIIAVEKIVKKWCSMGIINVEALMEHLKTKDERVYYYERVMKSLGFVGRFISEGERKVVDKWFDEYGYSLEMVLRACENSRKTSNPSINYIDGTISSWYSKGIKTIDEIEEKDKLPSKKEYKSYGKEQKNDKKPAKNRFHNFEQRSCNYSEEELEEIARKKREKYYFKGKGE